MGETRSRRRAHKHERAGGGDSWNQHVPKVEDTAIYVTNGLGHSLRLTESSISKDTPRADARIGRDADSPTYRDAARTGRAGAPGSGGGVCGVCAKQG